MASYHAVRAQYAAVEAIIAGRGRQRRRIIAPIGDQFIQSARFQHGAGEDMRANLAALFNQAHAKFGRELFQANRRGQARRPAPHDQHIKFHRFPFFGHHARPFLMAICPM